MKTLIVVDVVQEEELRENMMMMTWLYLCRRRSGKITSIPRLTTGKSKRQIVPCQSLIIKRLMTSSQKLLHLRLLKYFIERKFELSGAFCSANFILFWRRQHLAQVERQNKCCKHNVESQFVTKPWVCGCPPKLEHYSHMMTYKAGWRAYILSKGKEMHSRHRDCVGPTHPPTQSPPQRLLSPTFVWKQISTGAYGFPPAHMDFIQYMWISTNAYGLQPTSTLKF